MRWNYRTRKRKSAGNERSLVDNYTFTAKAGQKLVFEVEARRAGSGVDPAIEIFDAANALGTLNIRGERSVTCWGEFDKHPSLGPLPPGASSALRHWHTLQDEFVFVLDFLGLSDPKHPAPAIDADWPRRGTRLGAEHESAATPQAAGAQQRHHCGNASD